MTELFSNISQILTDPEDLIRFGGWLLLIAIIYIESGFFIGMFLPGGDYTLFTAGLLSGTAILNVPVEYLIPSLILASFLGDLTGFYKGRWLGPKLFTKEKSRVFKPSYLEKTKGFYEKYGMIAFISGKFLPVIRALIPMLAGASGFTQSRMYVISIIGSTCWVTSLILTGYFIGHYFPDILEYKALLMIGFVVLASIPALRIFLGKRKKA
ncbi:MAG: DedA family protein [Bacteroidales bacterium]